MLVKKLTTSRLLLRPLTREDVSEMYVGWLNDPAVNQYLETRFSVQTLDSCLASVNSTNADQNSYLFGMFDLYGHSHIGNIKLGPINKQHKIGDLSLFIGDKSFWGNGLATEAICAMTQWAFESLGLDKVEAGCYEMNHACLNCFLKCGFSIDGLIPNQVNFGNDRFGCFRLGIGRTQPTAPTVNPIKQRDVFLGSEGDNWHKRNSLELIQKEFDENDSILNSISKIAPCLPANSNLLEIGCGLGRRLKRINEKFGLQCHGIDPSAKSVDFANLLGVHAMRGTADRLPYHSSKFDVVIFGFCLYLCDRQDLFAIAQEADRVLKSDGWLIIQDFISEGPGRHKYAHDSRISTYKMDYRKLFDWNPAYFCFHHEVNSHRENTFTDVQNEWVATSILRKKMI